MVQMILRADVDFKSNCMKFPESIKTKQLRMKRREGHHYGVLEANIPFLPRCQHVPVTETGNETGRKGHKRSQTHITPLSDDNQAFC
jgi:hypothetical protein